MKKQTKDQELAQLRLEVIEEATENFKTAAKAAQQIFGTVPTAATIAGVHGRIFQWEEREDQLQALDDLKDSAKIAAEVMPAQGVEQHALLTFAVYDAVFDEED